MRKSTMVILLLLAVQFATAGDSDRDPLEINTTDASSGFQLLPLNANGYSPHFNDRAAGIQAINPASLIYFKQLSAGIAFQFATGTDKKYYENISRNTEQLNPEIPTSAAVILPYKNLRIGLGFGQLFNAKQTTGPFSGINSYGDTLSFDVVEETRIYSYSAAISYLFRDLIAKSDLFAIGGSFYYDDVNYSNQIDTYSTNHSFSGIRFALGIIYSAKEKYDFGLSFEQGGKHTKDLEGNLVATAYIPGRINFGFRFRELIPLIDVTGNIGRVFRENQDYSDNFEYSMSIGFNPSTKWSASVGFFSTENIYTGSNIFESDEQVFYLTGGIRIDFAPLQLDFAVADSHLSSTESRQQTVLKFSAGYGF